MIRKTVVFWLIIPGTLFLLHSTGNAQWLSGGVIDVAAQKWMVALGAQYSELDWQKEGIKTFNRETCAEVDFSILSWMSVAGNVGYRMLHLRKAVGNEIQFDPDFYFGGSLYLGPFYLFPEKFALMGSFSGMWFNPYGKKENSGLVHQPAWSEREEFIFESTKSSFCANVVYRTHLFDVFVGPTLSVCNYKLKSRRLLEDDVNSYISEVSSESFYSDIVIGFSGGIGLKLPGRYYVDLGVRNDNLNVVEFTISIAQVGSP